MFESPQWLLTDPRKQNLNINSLLMHEGPHKKPMPMCLLCMANKKLLSRLMPKHIFKISRIKKQPWRALKIKQN